MSAIPAGYEVPPLDPPHRSFDFVDENGRLTEEGHSLLLQFREFINGCGRVIPCALEMAVNTAVLTIPPSGPVVSGYKDFDIFVGVADATSTGAVTATVVTRAGASLSELKVFKSNGAAQAGLGDIVSGSLYLFVFADHLDSGAGGLVLK